MKCCSLKRKDLNFHFKKMSHKYYMLNGLNDETLRQVYINSLPDELQAEIHRHMASTRRDLRNTSLSEIHQIKLFSNMLKDKAKFDKRDHGTARCARDEGGGNAPVSTATWWRDHRSRRLKNI
ncbi:hypothetical protein ACOSP7_015159 [Xanthoceras sorbifolium]